MVALVTSQFTAATRDAKGWGKTYRYWLTADVADANYAADLTQAAAVLEAAILGLTNAALSRRASLALGQSEQDLTYGTAAAYIGNWMQARMMFTTAKGTKSVFGIGAPKVAIFDTDLITVLNDGTQALVVAYVDAVKNATGTAFVSTEDGQAYTHFVGGILKVGKQPKRFNEFIKSSHLVQGEGE